jgi:hypothetical protein
MLEFFESFLAFNQNAFLTVFYFIYKNIWLLLGMFSIGYIFFAEQFAEVEDEVRDERQIL